MNVLALDPGDRVGWARATIDNGGQWGAFRHGITPLKQMALAVHEQASEYDVIVYEKWALYAQQAKAMIGSTFPSVQFIGMVKLSAWLNGCQLVEQGAAIKKVADARMKVERPDLYELVTRPIAHDDGHDQDAIRHLFYWQFKKGLKSE